jgi:cell division protein ZapB
MNSQPIDTAKSLAQEQVGNLEAAVTKLITLCKKLSDENSTYKGSNKQLMLERSELQSKNDKVRGQVEAMVNRLKAMDKAS